LIVFDNHLHLRRDGRYLDAVKDFKRAGGTHFVLCQYPMPSLVIKEKSYEKVYQKTLKMADEILSQINIGVFVTVGPYPVDYIKLSEKFGRTKTIEIMKKGMDQAAELCENGDCIAIGEIGRPHFQVDEQVVLDSNEILQYGMQKAKEAGVPVVLHTESTTPENCKEFVAMGKKIGLKADKIIKHYSPPLITKQENSGLFPSVLGNKKNITISIKKGTRFMLETDYIDDPKRPGAVLGPKTIPKNTISMIKEDMMTEDQAYKIHKDNPEKVYDIELN